MHLENLTSYVLFKSVHYAILYLYHTREVLHMDNETKVMLETILTKLDKMDSRLDVLEQGQQDIKDFIVRNNVAIGEIITQALESNDSKVSKIEKVTKDNLYEIALLKQQAK